VPNDKASGGIFAVDGLVGLAMRLPSLTARADDTVAQAVLSPSPEPALIRPTEYDLRSVALKEILR
jgi:hypothetical protein